MSTLLNEKRIKEMEEQIYKEQKNVDYDTREFTIEIVVKKYKEGLETEENEIFVPDYQREFVWEEDRQSKFIESIVLGLPIPLIFVAENTDGRLEIVDGSQRIRTLNAFLSDELELIKLEKLTRLNGLKFSNISESRQRKFKNIPIRMIVLSENATEEVKNDMFERINRGSDLLKDMEKRKGIYRGKFNDFIYNECANERFRNLTPVSKFFINRQEHEELILRFFALVDCYPNYQRNTGIARFLDYYLERKNNSLTEGEKHEKWKDFNRMLDFVEKYFEHGFAKSDLPQVSRVYFEAIAVGIHLALKEKPSLSTSKEEVKRWLYSREFKNIISGKYHTHTPDRIKQRVEYVRDRLLKKNV